MGLFDIFKKKDPALNQALSKIQEQVAPGGRDGLAKIVDELMTLTNHKCSRDILTKVYLYQSSLFAIAGDKSAARIVGGTLLRKDYGVSEELATQVYNYVLKRYAEQNFGMADARLLEMLNASFGNVPMNCTGDVINGATGPYGCCPDNPIPVRGIPKSEQYLSHLRDQKGQRVTWKRLGSFNSSISDHPVDMYIIYDQSGQEIGKVYISAYQAITAKTAPEGFLYVDE